MVNLCIVAYIVKDKVLKLDAYGIPVDIGTVKEKLQNFIQSHK